MRRISDAYSSIGKLDARAERAQIYITSNIKSL